MGSAQSTNGREEECTWDVDGKARRKETVRKIKSGWLGNIKVDLRDIGLGGIV
jgi:hypothetical protein